MNKSVLLNNILNVQAAIAKLEAEKDHLIGQLGKDNYIKLSELSVKIVITRFKLRAAKVESKESIRRELELLEELFRHYLE